MGRFGQQAGFATPRFTFQQNQSSFALTCRTQLLIQRSEFRRAGNKRRLGESFTIVVSANHHRRFAFAAFDGGGNRVQIGQHRRRRLVTIARILAQQALHDFIKLRGTEIPKLRNLGTSAVMCSNNIVPSSVPVNGGRPARQWNNVTPAE